MGIYKSTDAGKTWQHLGLENTSTIARVVIHPTNPDVVYVAASGNEWSYNKDRGVFKTTDGGKTWSKVLYQNEKTGCIDLLIDPFHFDLSRKVLLKSVYEIFCSFIEHFE